MPDNDEIDGPWKAALGGYFRDFLALLFPRVHDGIQWDVAPEVLDSEMQQLAPASALGTRTVDKLVRVRLLTGEPACVLVHVEVQAQRDRGFAERIYVYNYRAFDRFAVPVVSLAVLADEERTWLPTAYHFGLWGFDLNLLFPTAKLQILSRETLEASTNPFAIVVLAHLDVQATAAEPERRLRAKVALVKLMLRKGRDRASIRRLFNVLDWLMKLPADLDQPFWKEVRAMQQTEPYVDSLTRIGMKVGREEGLEEGLSRGRRLAIIDVLRARFGDAPDWALAGVAAVSVEDRLVELLRLAATVPDLTAFRAGVEG